MSGSEKSTKRIWLKILLVIQSVLAGVVVFLLITWGTLSQYYSNLPWTNVRLLLAALFCLFGVWAFWIARRGWMKLAFAATFILVLAWQVLIPPSHQREWALETSVMPRALIEGDRVTLTGFRNFDFKTAREFIPRFEERVVNLSEITSVDFFISYWAEGGPIGHTFVSFNFENAPPVSISIEVRPEVHEGYDPLGSIFKQYELIYIVGDERDIVRWRTNYRDEDVYLYRINAAPDGARRLFEVYLERINELADRAEWYHLFRNNCGLNIVRYANLAGREGRFNIRHLLNGWMDRYFYSVGLVDNSLPFAELREKSHINDAALAAEDDPEFSRTIRKSLPNMH